MGKPSLTNFTTIKSDSLCQPTVIDQLNRPPHLAHLKEFIEQAGLARKRFGKQLQTINRKIITELDTFIDSSIDCDSRHLFATGRTERMHGAVLYLDMQTTDHEPTFDCIENHIKTRRRSMYVIRIGRDLIRKRGLLELLETCKNFSQIFVLIEQAETLNVSLTNTLIGHFRGRLQDDESPAQVVLMLFCLSAKIQDLALDATNCFGKITSIVRDKDLDSKDVLESLLRNEGSKFKIGANLLTLIYHCFIECDNSITNLSLMYIYAMYEYYSHLDNCEISSDGKKHKTSHSTSNKGLDSALKYHDFICDQMYYYQELLQDRGKFPDDVTYIYDELFAHDELAHSIDFIDAIKGIIKFPRQAILRRIEQVEKKFHDFGKTKKNNDDVVEILSKYKERIDNNEDCDIIVTNLVDELLEHARVLKNPNSLGHGHIYYNDSDAINDHILRSSRNNKRQIRCYHDDSTYFGALFNQILDSPGHISINDLFNDVLPSLRELIRTDRTQLVASSKGPRRKFTTPRKSIRTTPVKAAATRPDVSKTLSDEDEIGLAKAIFIDLIDCMEQNQLIKIDKRSIKGSMIKRLVWL